VSSGEPARWGRRLLIAALVALVAAVSHQAIGAAVFLPRFASKDQHEVVRAYFEARRWGLEGLSERALDPRVREQYHTPKFVDPLIADALLAGDLRVEAGPDISQEGAWFEGDFAEVRLFTVTYVSRWRSTIGEPPGPRHWFVYAGRNAGEPWEVLGQGSGP
jgi:hypothetical protein